MNMTKQEIKEIRERLNGRISEICDSKDRELGLSMSREDLDNLKDTVVTKIENIGYEYIESQCNKYAKGLANKKGVEKSVEYLLDKIENEIPKVETMTAIEVLSGLFPLGFYYNALNYIGENLM